MQYDPMSQTASEMQTHSICTVSLQHVRQQDSHSANQNNRGDVPALDCVQNETREVSDTTCKSSHDSMDIDEDLVPASQDMYEPARKLNHFARPKRFYRTFWRSMSRRILALSGNDASQQRGTTL